MKTMKLSAPDWCFFPKGADPDAYYRKLKSMGYSGVEMVEPERWQSAKNAGLEIVNLSGPGMSSRERILRMFEHREADRVPIVDRPWGGDTIARWHREGMPENVDYQDYFELDKMRVLYLDISPRFPEETIEETPEYIIHTTVWGETRKTLRSSSTTPQSLDFAIKTPDDWRRVKARITPSRDRIHWRSLKTDYAKWRHEGAFFMPSLFFGFDVTHSYMVGFETMLIALIEDPEWCREMFAHQLEVSLAQADMLWNEGYVFDAMRWPDDMVDDLAVGDPLELRYDDYSPTGFTSKIAGIEKLKSPTGANQLKITLEEPLPEQKGKGFVYFNRRYDSGNVIIRNCRVHDNRGRGILIHPENVTVEDNTFFHTERSAVMVLCGYANTWSEGYGASNIVIRNNRFDRIARLKEREMFPVIYISVYRNTDPSREKTDFPILRDILIEGNEFLDSPGAIVYAAAVKNLTIRGNTIEAMTPRNYDFYYRGSIGTESSSDIYVTGNRWRESPLVPEPGIFLDKNTSRDVYCWDNQVLHQESRTGEK